MTSDFERCRAFCHENWRVNPLPHCEQPYPSCCCFLFLQPALLHGLIRVNSSTAIRVFELCGFSSLRARRAEMRAPRQQKGFLNPLCTTSQARNRLVALWAKVYSPRPFCAVLLKTTPAHSVRISTLYAFFWNHALLIQAARGRQSLYAAARFAGYRILPPSRLASIGLLMKTDRLQRPRDSTLGRRRPDQRHACPT